MKLRIVVWLALGGALTAGCGSSAPGAQVGAAHAPTANVSGVWTGRAETRGALVPVTMTLSQTGTSFTGDMSVGGWSRLTGGVTGSVQGELLTLSLERVTLGELTVKQDLMTGQVSAGLPVNLRRSK
ncbi:MAG: hypothetical protein ACREK4_07145 [Candidatus Rokuibacteriota bacterium]